MLFLFSHYFNQKLLRGVKGPHGMGDLLALALLSWHYVNLILLLLPEVIMKAVTYDFARSHFDEVFNMIQVQNEGVIIVKDDKNFVLMDKNLLDSVVETAELSEDKEFVASLKAAKAEIQRGESFTFEDVFGEKL
jgi:PHD/YefM family antitoxin component YafN of YafNO toxin-antitoxin module